MIRLTRATRFLPTARGTTRLIRLSRLLSRPFSQPRELHRIANFDGDLQLDVDPWETMGEAFWYIPQLWEKQERKLFCSAITPGCNVLDVGAHIGAYTLLAAKRGARVFSIEADPMNAARLRFHLELNALGQHVTVFEMAALDRESTALLLRNPSNSGNSRIDGTGDVATPGRTIDSLGLPSIELCKMDIEGSELAALRGMQETLARSPRMKLLIEYRFLSDKAALFSFLHSHFAHVAVAGAAELNGNAPTSDCNLWCWNH
jgi:FkbM family methyltransferase